MFNKKNLIKIMTCAFFIAQSLYPSSNINNHTTSVASRQRTQYIPSMIMDGINWGPKLYAYIENPGLNNPTETTDTKSGIRTLQYREGLVSKMYPSGKIKVKRMPHGPSLAQDADGSIHSVVFDCGND